MSEKNFSATFRMYSLDGLSVQFTVREDDARAHQVALSEYLAALSAGGWRVTEPTGDARPKTLHVAGVVLGTAEDRNRAEFMPCVHLYAAHGDYKQATVYHERLADLPINISTLPRWDGAAPDRETAMKRKVWIDAKFDVLLEPVLDADGNPILTEKGRVRYKYAGVLPSSLATVPEMSDGRQNGNGGEPPPPPWMVTLDEIGQECYGDEWANQAAKLAAYISSNRTTKIGGLSEKEAVYLIDGITAKMLKTVPAGK